MGRGMDTHGCGKRPEKEITRDLFQYELSRFVVACIFERKALTNSLLISYTMLTALSYLLQNGLLPYCL